MSLPPLSTTDPGDGPTKDFSRGPGTHPPRTHTHNRTPAPTCHWRLLSWLPPVSTWGRTAAPYRPRITDDATCFSFLCLAGPTLAHRTRHLFFFCSLFFFSLHMTKNSIDPISLRLSQRRSTRISTFFCFLFRLPLLLHLPNAKRRITLRERRGGGGEKE